MPPKKANGPSKKTQDKAKQKVVEDKTFGLKNKNKSKAVQKFVKGVEGSVGVHQKSGGKTYEQKQKEKQEEEAKRLEQSLFKPVVAAQKTPVGVDPKSIVCEFFKKGMCSKGDKCKYSHNLEQERKVEKIDLYTDRRDIENGGNPDEKKVKIDDNMENWDQLKLETVVNTKHGTEAKSNRNKIVCKYFLEAIEQKKYGWFWECPNGGDKCPYMHSLPPGFVLKQTKKEDEDVEKQPIEEIIEEARALLTKRTPLTKELFLKWKEDKKKKKDEESLEKKDKRDSDIKAGKAMRSGKEMFEFNPDLFIDEEDVLDAQELVPEPDEDEGPVRYIEATSTSISLTITNNDEENNNEEEEEGKVKVNADLFQEDDIPDEDE